MRSTTRSYLQGICWSITANYCLCFGLPLTCVFRSATFYISVAIARLETVGAVRLHPALDNPIRCAVRCTACVCVCVWVGRAHPDVRTRGMHACRTSLEYHSSSGQHEFWSRCRYSCQQFVTWSRSFGLAFTFPGTWTTLEPRRQRHTPRVRWHLDSPHNTAQTPLTTPCCSCNAISYNFNFITC